MLLEEKLLKEAGFTHWNSPNTGTDDYGFKMPGSGWRTPDEGTFSTIKENGFVLSTDEYSSDLMYSYINPKYNSDLLSATGPIYNKKTGMSVRLVYVGAGIPTEYIGNNGGKI